MSRQPLFSVTIEDCRVDTFRAGGKGGQHQNKTETGVRVVHPPSGAVGEARDSRSQHDNKRAAFRRMVESAEFKAWHTRTAAELLSGETIDQKVDKLMDTRHLKVEVRDDDGRWVVWREG